MGLMGNLTDECGYKPILEALEPRLLLDGMTAEQGIELFHTTPAVFIENQGQWDSSVRFVHKGQGANIAHTDSGPVFELFREVVGDETAAPADILNGRFDAEPAEMEHLRFSASFDGANALTPVGIDEAETRFNFLLGDQSQWRQNVPSYEIVAYEGLYDGIDLHTWGRRDHLKYEFHVAPGADFSQISVSYSGVDALEIDEDGALHVHLGGDWGEVVDDTPYIYQIVDGEQVEVAGVYRLVDGDTYAFEITGGYDPTRRLIIDPDLGWSTYLGGSDTDRGYGIAVDAADNALVTGQTYSAGWVSGGGDTSHAGSVDGFVVKLSTSGGHLWSTYMGGSSSDYGQAIAVDASGNALVAGPTWSSGWVSGGWDTSYGGNHDSDGFVVKLSVSGGHLWSSYLGGSDSDHGIGIAVDADGNALVTGYTYSSGWVSGGWDTTYGGNGLYDGFVVKLNPTGGHIWSSYVGGWHYDSGTGIAVDASDNALVTGYTQSPDWVSGGWDTSLGGKWDAFVVKLSPTGGHIWSSYLGGSDGEWGDGIAVDASGKVLVTGQTSSSGWVSGGGDTSYNGGNDAFVVKLSPTGGHIWSSYLGGSGYDRGYDIATDAIGNALVTGRTDSAGWVSGGWDASHNGGKDAFVLKLSASGDHLWSSYLGGSGWDEGHGIAADRAGNALVTGYTESSGWISDGWDTSHNGGWDAFVAKIGEAAPPTPPDLYGTNCILLADELDWSDTPPIQGQVHNGGGTPVTTDFRVDFCLSNDLNFGDSDDVLLDSYSHTDDIAANASGPQFSITLSLPDEPPAGYSRTGTFYIGMKTDPGNDISESDETNNFGTVGEHSDWDSLTVVSVEQFVITGKVVYRDVDAWMRNARHVRVEAWEKQVIPFTDYKIAEGYTDGAGNFKFTHDTQGQALTNADWGLGESGTRDIYFKLRAENEAAKVAFEFLGGAIGIIYWHDSDVEYDVSGPSYNRSFGLSSTVATPNHAAAWGIPGYIKQAKDWLWQETGWSRPLLGVLYPNIFLIFPETWPGYRPLFDVISIPEDWADYGESVLAHEYGHAVHWYARGGNLPAPGREHTIRSETDEAFAITEGWAEFFQAAVFGNENIDSLWLEQNTYWMGGDADGSNNFGNIVEGAVASVLWDLFDGIGDDGLSEGFGRIWNVFLNDDPDSIWNAAGIDDFYHYWTIRYAQTRALDEIFIDHGMPVRDDSHEENDSSETATPLTNIHTSYPHLILSEAADWFVFTLEGTATASSSVSISFEHDQGDLNVYVYDGSLDLIGSSSGIADIESVSMAGQLAGIYYVKVEGDWGDFSPDYDLVLDLHTNDPPTNISLSSATVVENKPSGTTVGAFSTIDPDVGDTFTYSLVGGSGSTDNSSFYVNGSQLKTASSFNYEAKNSYSIRVRSTDQGGLYTEKVFTIDVTDVNDPPVAVNSSYDGEEDHLCAVAMSVSDEDDGALDCIVISGPHHGTLHPGTGSSRTYEPDSDWHGTDSFTFKAWDGDAYSNEATVTVEVESVNDAPLFTKGAKQAVNEDAGLQTVAGWATGISAGPTNESGQTVSFIVSNDNNGLFSQQPTVSADGTLTFTPTSDAYGTAEVTVQARDNGGTANGGDNTSDAQSFRITVTGLFDDDEYEMLVSQFGLRGDGLAADFNGDGRVDLADFAITRANFGNMLPPAAPAAALQAAGEPIAAVAAPVVPVVSHPLGNNNDASDDSIAAAASAPAIDLLAESPSAAGYVSGSQAISGGPSAMTLYRAATVEYDLRPPSDDLLAGEADDLLADILAESALALPL